MVIVEDQIHSSLSKIIKKGKQVAVIPVGSVEQHGPHLPVSTDSDIVTDIAKKLSKKMDFLLLPTVTYGVSFEHYHHLLQLEHKPFNFTEIIIRTLFITINQWNSWNLR